VNVVEAQFTLRRSGGELGGCNLASRDNPSKSAVYWQDAFRAIGTVVSMVHVWYTGPTGG
ncbi:hypothetical protein EDD17DRAFT_1616836, partial [Pisolithus thermaeus]